MEVMAKFLVPRVYSRPVGRSIANTAIKHFIDILIYVGHNHAR